jgi:hypothetical protein
LDTREIRLVRIGWSGTQPTVACLEKTLMPVGRFRGEGGWVEVDYGTGTTIPVPRSKYEANGYKPDFDKLPSEAEYWATENKKEDDAPRS